MNSRGKFPMQNDSEIKTRKLFSAACKSSTLSCKINTAKMTTKIMLIACGSFNPPTPMHLRMFGKLDEIIFFSQFSENLF